MDQKYRDWINQFLKRNCNDVRGKCNQATLEMKGEFPELIRVRGVVFSFDYGCERNHWWLKTVDNEIIDPTAVQFNTLEYYHERDESLPEPLGKCYNCGEFCYESQEFCSDLCQHEYMVYLIGAL